MIRRTPEAIVIAHTMDRSRRELYVEGLRDRVFLSWLLDQSTDDVALILEIDFVDLPGPVLGGNRGRLIQFANWLGDREIQIRMLADADWDRVLDRPVPDRVWLTDHRDMEGYILCERCLDKVLRLGIGTEGVSAATLLAVVLEQGRRLGVLRLASELNNMNLPFQDTDLSRHVSGDGARVSVDFDGYLRSLLQNAGISLARFDEIRARVQEVAERFASTPERELVHGKDTLHVLEVALRKMRVKQGECGRLLWTSFEATFVETGSVLEAVASYIRAQAPRQKET
jgi:hypothetical protein